MLFDLPDIASGTQGLACDSLSQTIAQLYGGKIITIDISSGSYVQRGSLLLGHGSTGQFAPNKLNQADLFPPLYVSTQNEQEINGNIYTMFLEIYVGESSVTLNRVFYVPFDGEEIGAGYKLFAFDFANNIVYGVYFDGYYTTTGTGRITAYSLNGFTSFPDGSYGPPAPQNGYMVAGTPLDTWEIDFIEQVQAITFFDGLIGILSDQPTESGRVIFYDPVQKSTYLTLNWLPTPFEREGISFILNPLTNRHDMILSRRASGVNEYYRYQFS